MAKIEEMVKKQALLLDKKMPQLVKDQAGKFVGQFVAFFDGATLIEKTHEACFNKAEKIFGRDRGFVINEITDRPLFVSSLIKF